MSFYKDNKEILWGLGAIGVMFMGLIGWILNIVEIMGTTGDITGLFVVRVVGILIAPIGAVLGWF